jgi:uncharacterized repeat protein (TIGR03803 family)
VFSTRREVSNPSPSASKSEPQRKPDSQLLNRTGETVGWVQVPGRRQPTSVLIEATDGNFYGTTLNRGAAGLGSVFAITPGGTMTELSDLNGVGDGTAPDAPLIQATDGNFLRYNFQRHHRAGPGDIGRRHADQQRKAFKCCRDSERASTRSASSHVPACPTTPKVRLQLLLASLVLFSYNNFCVKFNVAMPEQHSNPLDWPTPRRA